MLSICFGGLVYSVHFWFYLILYTVKLVKKVKILENTLNIYAFMEFIRNI